MRLEGKRYPERENQCYFMADAGPCSTSIETKPVGEFSERELILKLLGEKRSLLAKIHDERKLSLRWKTECVQLREENERLRRESVKSSRTDISSEFVNSTPSKQEDLHGLQVRSLHKKISILDTSLREAKIQSETLSSQKSVLESELFRLANTLSQADPELETELLKEQLKLYEEDFAKEKNDKVSAEGKLTNLNEQIHDCQELISNLNIEVDMYKKAYQREKRDKEMLLVHTDQSFGHQLPCQQAGTRYHPIPRSRVSPKPQLQVVYPVLDTSKEQEDELKRRQQLQRAGVFSRNVPKSPTNISPYGGDVETDYFWRS